MKNLHINLIIVTLMLAIGYSHPPIVFDDEYTLDEDTQIFIDIYATHSYGYNVFINIINEPEFGTLEITGGGGGGNTSMLQVLYIPNINYYGTDSFTYNAIHDEYISEDATITFIVNPVNDSSTFGYLREIEVSDCQDGCSQYAIHHEVEDSEPINVIFQDSTMNIDLYTNRFVKVELGEEVTCVECSAFEVNSISISDDCWFPVDCFVDPCEVAEECALNTPVECIPNYCDGCYADFYDLDGNLVDCNFRFIY